MPPAPNMNWVNEGRATLALMREQPWNKEGKSKTDWLHERSHKLGHTHSYVGRCEQAVRFIDEVLHGGENLPLMAIEELKRLHKREPKAVGEWFRKITRGEVPYRELTLYNQKREGKRTRSTKTQAQPKPARQQPQPEPEPEPEPVPVPVPEAGIQETLIELDGIANILDTIAHPDLAESIRSCILAIHKASQRR